MPRRGELKRWLIVERNDGSRVVFSVYENGDAQIIVTDQGGEHLVSPDQKIERELLIQCNVTIVRAVPLSEGPPSLD